MSEWKEYTTAKLIADNILKIGDGYRAKNSELVKEGLPFARVFNINGGFLFKNIECLPYSYENIAREKISCAGDIVFTSKGTVGRFAFVNDNVRKFVYSPQLCYWRVLDATKINPKFLYYLMQGKDFLSQIEGLKGQTDMADYVSLSDQRKMLVTFPELLEQKAIAQVLSSIDDKIDLLHRQNATLEAMAETLFRQWFVEEAKEDWENTTLYDSIVLIGGGTPKTSVFEYWDGNIKWLSGGDIANNHKSIIISSEKTITEEGLKNSSAKLLPKYSTVISARGTVGKYCILSEPMTFSQSNYGIKPKYTGCYFFTYLLINHSVEELQSAAYGSVFDTITTDTFKGHIIQLPSQVEVEKFEGKVKSYFIKIFNNQTQIRTLTTLRDTLLPKLMSGEVRIKY